jgi:signal transduction histidine kinase
MTDLSKPELKPDFLPRLGRHLAHELNNPISAISSAAFLIQDFIETAEDGKVEIESIGPFVESISEECDKLKATVEEFSKYVSMESVLAMPLEVNEFVRMRVADMTRAGEPVTCHESGSPLTIIGDAGALQFVLQSLVAYSLQSGATQVSISVSLDGKTCAVVVGDNRMQPPTSDEIADVFNPLPKRRTSGLGLKLPLVKKLIELHHGSIELTAPDSGGAAVCIMLPLGT